MATVRRCRVSINGADGIKGSNFFRQERDFILKEASFKIGQRIFAVYRPSRRTFDGFQPERAEEFYYFEDAATPATERSAEICRRSSGCSRKRQSGSRDPMLRCSPMRLLLIPDPFDTTTSSTR